MKKIQQKIFIIFFKLNFSKIAIYLSLGLHKGHPSYRKSLQPSTKENIQHLKKLNLLTFLFLRVIFAPLDLDPDCETGSRDPIESGYTKLFRK
jgi:hypothetical protein